MNTPLLHVMIPVYGESFFLRDTLFAATKNLPEDVFITVVEDPSTDYNLEKLVREFPRIEYVKNDKRLGITGNFNKCVSLSKGIYTQIIGSDDIITSSNYSEVIKKNILNIKTSAPDLIIFDASVIDENNKPTVGIIDLTKKIFKPRKNGFIKNKRLIKSLLLGQWIYFPATLWRTTEIQKNNFDVKYSSAFDLNSLLFFCVSDKIIYYSNNQIIAYRRHKQSVSSLKASDGTRFLEELDIHKKYSKKFKKDKKFIELILAKAAVTVRINMFYSFLKSK